MEETWLTSAAESLVHRWCLNPWCGCCLCAASSPSAILYRFKINSPQECFCKIRIYLVIKTCQSRRDSLASSGDLAKSSNVGWGSDIYIRGSFIISILTTRSHSDKCRNPGHYVLVNLFTEDLCIFLMIHMFTESCGILLSRSFRIISVQ